MACDRVRARLNALVDGEIRPEETSEIHGHLVRCPACAAECAALRRLGEQARAWRSVRAPDALRARLVAAILAAGFEPSCDEEPAFGETGDALALLREEPNKEHDTKGNNP